MSYAEILIREADGWLREHEARDDEFFFAATRLRLAVLRRAAGMNRRRLTQEVVQVVERLNHSNREPWVAVKAEAYVQALGAEYSLRVVRSHHPNLPSRYEITRYGRKLYPEDLRS